MDESEGYIQPIKPKKFPKYEPMDEIPEGVEVIRGMTESTKYLKNKKLRKVGGGKLRPVDGIGAEGDESL